jgi:flagellar assembly protein FliH
MPPPTFQTSFANPEARGSFVTAFADGASPFATAAFAKPPAEVAPPTPDPAQTLAAARREAEALLAAAHAEAEALVPQVVSEAQREAREQEVAAFALARDELLSELHRAWEERLSALERDAALLVTDLLARLLHERHEADSAAVLPVVREALGRLADSVRVQLVIPPHHEPAVRAAHDELAQLLAADSRLEIVASADLTCGGCLAHGDHASVDGRLETQLGAVDEALREAVAAQ